MHISSTAALIASLALATTTFSSPILKRIVGGEPVQPGELPFAAKFTFRYGRCTGSLIGPQTILTAAHCLKTSRFQYNAVEVAGMVFPSDETTHVYHPQYEHGINDIGLVFIPKKLPGPYPQIGCDYPQPESKIMAAGFGDVDNNGTETDVLRKVELTVEDKTVCLAHYPTFLNDTQFCTRDTPQSVCVGDSGGPLLVGANENTTIVGITSHGVKQDACGSKGNFQYYTFVHPYMQWINEEIARFEKNATVPTLQDS
ncbi:hypothetical protein BGZ75_004795 [Mortierella antarctica]|nr:hypothetical protein BGZ67_005085 [Mortierella alpina]KAF9983716.1 hypothetical protein BGZ75_004795 [Mortierella antarctica]